MGRRQHIPLPRHRLRDFCCFCCYLLETLHTKKLKEETMRTVESKSVGSLAIFIVSATLFALLLSLWLTGDFESETSIINELKHVSGSSNDEPISSSIFAAMISLPNPWDFIASCVATHFGEGSLQFVPEEVIYNLQNLNDKLRRFAKQYTSRVIAAISSVSHKDSVAYSATMQTVPSYVTPRSVPYFPLLVKGPFEMLEPKQRLYAHFLNAAGWSGTAVVAQQLSPESLPLLKYFFHVFDTVPVAQFRQRAEASGIERDDVDKALEYVALLYSNMGNYLSFGDSKFIPATDKETFCKVFNVCGGSDVPSELLEEMFDVHESKLSLAFPPAGITAYYSANFSEAEAKKANAFLESKGMSGYNTRVFKDDVTGKYHIKLASSIVKASEEFSFDGATFVIEYGDFAAYMTEVVKNIEAALPYTENEIQTRMLNAYIAHFKGGNIEDHKESQRQWVTDKGPIVESNIGFIESYRDPSGVRGEWEGLVAVVDKDQSSKFAALVGEAAALIPTLPWGKEFEKDVFTQPDFTSLKVLGFASSGIPAGICIPNYDDIRQDVGFKNVYLDNVVSAINFDVKLNHLTDSDWAVYKKGFLAAMSVNVGVHELLGHGTGKLFMEREDGSLNYDSNIVNPITNERVSSHYKAGETWGSKFGGLANAYEECRAEAVALYLGLHEKVLSIFGQTTEEDRKATVHVLWLNMVRAGLVGLEFYTPETSQWRQAHMRARFCILQTLLAANLVTITHNDSDLLIEIDAAKIETVGKDAIGQLLCHLNIFKATADVERGSAYFEKLTTVSSEFVKIRETVLKLRKPRKQFVQPHTRLNGPQGTDAVLVEFPGTVDGAIEAMVARHRDIPL